MSGWPMSLINGVGRGPRFPLRPDPWTGGLGYVDGMEIIPQSVATRLDNERGERIMLATFGCGLWRYLMQPDALRTRTSMQAHITTALGLWKPCITLVNVSRPDPPYGEP
jgi:phage baseplate assembly protein W